MYHADLLEMLHRFVFIPLALMMASRALGTPAVLGWTENLEFQNSGVSGFDFVPRSEVLVTALLLWDSASNGFAVSHEVGIFDTASQSKLISAVVPAGLAAPAVGPVINDGIFRSVAISPFLLHAGITYSMLGDDITPDGISRADDPTVVLSPDLMFVRGRGQNVGPGLIFPTATAGLSFFSGSFDYRFVPEPSSTLLLILGSVTLAACGGRVRAVHVAR